MSALQYPDLPANLQYLCRLIMVREGENQRSIAAKAMVSPSVLTRLLNGERNPSETTLARLVNFFKIDRDVLISSHDKFVIIAESVYGDDTNPQIFRESTAQRVWLRSIARDSGKWRRTYEIHKGQYIIYNRLSSGKIAASLLEISEISDKGLHFTIINPFIGVDGVIRDFRYAGLLFPVSDYLYAIAEQDFGDYEIISMIIEQSATSIPEFQQGWMLAIAVREGKKQIASNNILLHYQSRPIRDWQDAVHKKRLGHIDEQDVIPSVVKNLRSIFDVSGVIAN